MEKELKNLFDSDNYYSKNIRKVLGVTLDNFLEINIPEVLSLKSELSNLLDNFNFKLSFQGEKYIEELSNIINNLGQKVYNSTVRNYEEFKKLKLEEMLYIIYNFGGDCNHISIFYKKLFDTLGLKSRIAHIDNHSDLLLDYNNKLYLVDSKGIEHIKVGTKIMGFNGLIGLINDDFIFINENRLRKGLKINLINELSNFNPSSSGKVSIHLRNLNRTKRTLDLNYNNNGVIFNIDGLNFILPETLIGSAIFKLNKNNIKGVLELVTKTDEYNFFAHYINKDSLIEFLENYNNFK